MIIMPETTECWEQLVRIVEVLTELQSTRVGLCDLRSSLTFRGNQRSPEGDQHRYFTLDALTGLRERGEQFHTLGEERDDLLEGMPLGGVLRCLVQILHGPPVVLPPLKVHRQLGRHLVYPRAIRLRLLFPHQPMQPYPAACPDARIHHLLIQRMPKAIAPTHRPVRPR